MRLFETIDRGLCWSRYFSRLDTISVGGGVRPGPTQTPNGGSEVRPPPPGGDAPDPTNPKKKRRYHVFTVGFWRGFAPVTETAVLLLLGKKKYYILSQDQEKGRNVSNSRAKFSNKSHICGNPNLAKDGHGQRGGTPVSKGSAWMQRATHRHGLS